jgi:hypothetical protein
MYRYDGSYAVEVQQAHPDRFAIVKPVDPDGPGGNTIARRLCVGPNVLRLAGIDGQALTRRAARRLIISEVDSEYR